MTNCKNCQFPIDGRSVVYCHKCNAPLHKECTITENDKIYCDLCYTIKEEDKHSYKDIEIPDVIRRSYIDTYQECPYKFYMQTIEGYEAPENPYSKVGIDLHSLFDKASQSCNYDSYKSKDMKEEFDEMWSQYDEKLFESNDQKFKLYQRAVESINNFYDILFTLPKEPFATETTVEFPVGNNLPYVSVTSDRVDEIDGELEIIDWKTGNVIVGKKLSSNIQAPLYIYGTKYKYNKPIRKFTFHFLNEGKSRTYDRINENEYVCNVRNKSYYINLPETIKSVQQTFNQIKKNNFNIPHDFKKMYYTCKICHLSQLGLCQGADIESWKTNKGG